MNGIISFLTNLLYGKNPKDNSSFDWKKLAKIDYVSIVRVIKINKGIGGLTRQLPSFDTSAYYYKLNVVIDNKRKKFVTIDSSYDKDELFRKAFEIKAHFHCRIFDCTNTQKQWID
jgi:hypothetical protein